MSKNKGLFEGIKKFLTQPSPSGTRLFEDNQKDLMASMRNTHLFRSLNGKEEEAVSVVDYRDITEGKPNNRVLITCEHASNDVKYTKLSDDEEHLQRSQHYHDIGAADLTFNLSEELKCVAVMGNFSRLFIDPSKPLSDMHLIRTTYRAPDNTIPVSFNAQGYRLYERLENFYLEYHKLLRESLDFLEPTCILNIHSHDPELSPSVDADVILYHPAGGNSKLI